LAAKKSILALAGNKTPLARALALVWAEKGRKKQKAKGQISREICPHMEIR